MKRFLFTLISIFCIYTSFGQTVLSGTWIFQYDYFIETGYPLSFPGTKEGESDIRNFDYVIQPDTGESLKKTIKTIEFIDAELLKITFFNDESKRFFYEIRSATCTWGTIPTPENYYGLILNKGKIVIGLKATENKNNSLVVYKADYFICI